MIDPEERLSCLETAMQSFIQNTADVKTSSLSVLNKVNKILESYDENPLEKRIEKLEGQVGRIFDRLESIQTWIVQLQDLIALKE